jgi:hypothetical protein
MPPFDLPHLGHDMRIGLHASSREILSNIFKNVLFIAIFNVKNNERQGSNMRDHPCSFTENMIISFISFWGRLKKIVRIFFQLRLAPIKRFAWILQLGSSISPSTGACFVIRQLQGLYHKRRGYERLKVFAHAMPDEDSRSNEQHKASVTHDAARSFYLGVRGKGCGRAGVFPSSAAAILNAAGIPSKRLLIMNRNLGYEDVFRLGGCPSTYLPRSSCVPIVIVVHHMHTA